jgi:hypothetical protein
MFYQDSFASQVMIMIFLFLIQWTFFTAFKGQCRINMQFLNPLIPTVINGMNAGVHMHITFLENPKIMPPAFGYCYTNYLLCCIINNQLCL